MRSENVESARDFLPSTVSSSVNSDAFDLTDLTDSRYEVRFFSSGGLLKISCSPQTESRPQELFYGQQSTNKYKNKNFTCLGAV